MLREEQANLSGRRGLGNRNSATLDLSTTEADYDAHHRVVWRAVVCAGYYYAG